MYAKCIYTDLYECIKVTNACHQEIFLFRSHFSTFHVENVQFN